MKPYDRYLRYLVSLHLKKTKIIKKMHDFGFDIDSKDIEKTKKDIMLPKVFKKYAEGEEVDEEYLLKYAYECDFGEFLEYKLKGEPKELAQSYDMMKDKYSRLIPLMLKVKGEKLVHKCMSELGYEYSQKAIELTLKLFWNIENMEFLDWKDYFPKKIMKMLEKPLPYIKYKFGINPKLEYGSILEDIMHESYYQYKNILDGRINKENVQMSKKFADTAIKAGEKLEKYGNQDTESFLDDVVLAFENANMEIEAKEIDDEEEHEIELI